MQAKDIMTTPVVTTTLETRVAEAADLMLTHHVSGLPVVDGGGRLVGLISEGDLMRRVGDPGGKRRSWWLELLRGDDAARDYVKAHGNAVADVMTRDVVTVAEDTPAAEIARLLEKHRIKRVPVLRAGKVVGIVSRANLLHGLSAGGAALAAPAEDDRALRARIDEALREAPGGSAGLVNCTVENGNVTVWGTADSTAEADAIRVAIANVPGVRSVEMNLGRIPAWGWGE